MTVSLPRVGDRFLDRYDLLRIVGHGGYGRIYEAVQVDIGRQVAIKVIAPPDEDDPGMSNETFAERFEREARAISQLRDPRTVTLYDHGEHDGLLYMVLEFIDGQTLTRVIAEHGALEPERVDRIIRQVLLSLMEAHAQGLIHRDVKPSNIMLYEHMGEPDQVKLLDFGLVKSITGEQVVDADNLTRDDVLVGTPRYMSPEQVRQEPISPATDVYSLGLVAYEMLSGAPLLTESQAMAIIARHIAREEFDLSDMPGTAQQRATVAKMLRKDPAERFETAGAALEALEAEIVPTKKAPPIVLSIAGVLGLLAVGAIAMSWPSPQPTARESVTSVAAVETPPDRTDKTEVDVAEARVAAPAVDHDQQRRLVSAVGWSTARVGFALESASNAVELASTKKRKPRKKRTKRDTRRDLRIFEP